MVQHASRPTPGEEQEDQGCRHHWIIDAPTGPVSRGVCQLCQDVREFKNYIEAAPWSEDTTTSQAGGGYSMLSSSDDVEDIEGP